jgi:hypothetical protein
MNDASYKKIIIFLLGEILFAYPSLFIAVKFLYPVVLDILESMGIYSFTIGLFFAGPVSIAFVFGIVTLIWKDFMFGKRKKKKVKIEFEI